MTRYKIGTALLLGAALALSAGLTSAQEEPHTEYEGRVRGLTRTPTNEKTRVRGPAALTLHEDGEVELVSTAADGSTVTVDGMIDVDTKFSYSLVTLVFDPDGAGELEPTATATGVLDGKIRRRRFIGRITAVDDVTRALTKLTFVGTHHEDHEH